MACKDFNVIQDQVVYEFTDYVRVTETLFVSLTFGAPHLSILLTDANVTVTTLYGKTQIFDLKAGPAFWSEAEPHVAINSGSKIARAYIVELQ